MRIVPRHYCYNQVLRLHAHSVYLLNGLSSIVTQNPALDQNSAPPVSTEKFRIMCYLGVFCCAVELALSPGVSDATNVIPDEFLDDEVHR